MNRKWVLLLSIPMVAAAGFVAACGDDDNAVIGKDAGGSDSNTTPTDSSTNDSATTDANDGAAPEKLTFTTVAQFNGAAYELPEGVVISGGAPIVGFAPQGRLVRVLGDGGTEPFASFAGASQTYVIGLALDTANNVYAAIGATGATPVPAPGIYKIPAAGGTPVPFAITGGFGFPNGLDFIGTDLYVGDSTGKIFKVDSLGNATVWKDDVELVGGQGVCMSQNGFDIGVNGIAHDDNYVYGVNLDKGSFFRIKRDADGGAGNVEVLYKNCDFFGADGLVRDSDGTFIVANNGKGRIDRVTINGTTATWKTIGTGAPLDGPASVFIEGSGNNKKLWVTNSAFGSAAADGGQPKPSLVSAPLK